MVIRYFYGKETLLSIANRFSISFNDKKFRNNELIWLHAASVGESLVAKTIIEEIELITSNKNRPLFLLTTGTISSSLVIAKWQKDNLIHHFKPLDNLITTYIFLMKWRPKLAIFIESDLWPVLIDTASKYCPLVLVNGRLSDGSFKLWLYKNSFFQRIISRFSHILVQSNRDLEKFNSLGIKNVSNLGNLKFSNKKLSINDYLLSSLNEICKEKKIVFFASTHAEDEQLIMPILKEVLSIDNILIIIAIRHPERRKELTDLCRKHDLSFSLRSQELLPQNSDDIFIVDSLGELGTFYYLANISFIGGSLKRGGHNLMEAAPFDCTIIVGPDMSNFQNITDEMMEKKAILRIKDAAELKQYLQKLLNDDSTEFARNAKKYVESKNKVVTNYMNILSDLI